MVKQLQPADSVLDKRPASSSKTKSGRLPTVTGEGERLRNTINPAKVKPGDLMAFINYVRVKSVEAEGAVLHVESLDDDGETISIRGEKLIAGAFSADQYHEVEQVTMTRAAEILITSFNRPLTVRFIKQKGDARVLRGRLLRPEPLLGRSYVEDLDETGTSRIRLVDHRTLVYLIVDGVKYTVKNRK